ncbi:MAG: hypothetical protein WC716_09565 [Chitinophagaceae bacterium]|jgi:hypothetical protein
MKNKLLQLSLRDKKLRKIALTSLICLTSQVAMSQSATGNIGQSEKTLETTLERIGNPQPGKV